MKKYLVLLSCLTLTQSSIQADGWFKTNWDKFKHKVENIFDKNKKATSKSEPKAKPTHEQAYELQQEVLKLEATANGLQQKILRAEFELKQMKEKHEQHHQQIREKQAKIKALHQPEMMHRTEHRHEEHKTEQKNSEHKKPEHKAPQMLHTKKAPASKK